MKELRATVLVGLLAIVSVALVILGVLNTRDSLGDDDTTWRVAAVFDDVTGIAAGTKVTIAGYPVGEVVSVTLQGTEALVTLRLRNDVALYEGQERAGKRVNSAMVTRVQASLLGDYYLELKPGAGGRKLEPGDRIPIVVTATAIEATLQRLETAADIIPNLNRIADDVAAITANARKVFGSDDGARRFDEIADNFVATSRNLVEGTDLLKARLQTGSLGPGGDLDRAIGSAYAFTRQANSFARDAKGWLDRGGASAMRSLEQTEVVTRSVRGMFQRNEKGLDVAIAGLATTLKRVDDSLAKLDAVVANLEDITARTRRGEGAVGRLLTNDTLVKEAEGLIKDSRSFANRFLGLQTGIDYQTNIYAGLPAADAEQWRSQLTLRVQPAPDKYYLATVSSDIYPTSTTLVRTTAGSSGGAGQPTKVESVREVGDTVKLGFQYVRRFGAVALRGGLIESRAGFGADAFLWGDRVQLAVDVFQLTDRRPRVRSHVLWRLLPWAYLQVGGDSLLTNERDVFAGVGVFFRDDDLLLLFASAPTVQF